MRIMESDIPFKLYYLFKVKLSTRELDKHVGVLHRTGGSILSFGVDVLNEVLASMVPNNSKVVEVGCEKNHFLEKFLAKISIGMG